MASNPRPANQTSGGTGHVPSKPAKKAPPKTYSWGKGQGGHSISLAAHEKHVKVKAPAAVAPVAGPYGIDINQPLTTPLTAGQAYGQAQDQASLQYQPQIQANKQLQVNAPVWFQNYMDTNNATKKAEAQYAAPILANAQTGVTNAAAPTAGLAAGSPQSAADEQAARGRSSLAQLGADTLSGQALAGQTYLGQQGELAARVLPQVRSDLVTQGGQLLGDQAAQAATNYGTIRTGEQNYGIAQATLGNTIANTQADNAQAAANAAQTAADKKAARVVSRKNTKDRVAASTQNAAAKTQAAADKKAAADAAKKAAADAKHHDAIQKATGAIKTKVSSAISDWDRYSRQTNPVTNPVTGAPVIDPKTKKQAQHKPTPDDIRNQLRSDGYTPTEIHVALLLRGRKKLSNAEVQALKAQDPNIRIPREWLPPKSKPIEGTPSHGGVN